MKNYEINALLLGLARFGCAKDYTKINRAELALTLEVSAWTLNRWIREAIEKGFVSVSRKGRSSLYKITEKGLLVLWDIRKILNAKLSSFLIIKGTVVKGLGEGAYYMSMPEYTKALSEALGFKPYPGTLNVKVYDRFIPLRAFLQRLGKIVTEGFKKGSKEYGGVSFLKTKVINSSGEEESGAVLFISKTKHGPEIMEVVAPLNLRKRLGLIDGSRVELVIYLG